MKAHRCARRGIAAALSLLAMTMAASASAQTYPAKPVRIVVGFAPGGGIDVMARTYAQRLSEALGQSFVVDNRPGASGNIAAELVAKAPPDGYTLLATSTVHSINPSLFAKLAFDPLKDFSPISSIASAPDCIAVHPSVPLTSLRALVDLAKASPGKLSYASAGSGTVMHVGMELFLSMAKVKMLHVPYNGSGPSTIAVLGGQVPVLSTSLGTALPHARAGKLRMLAVTSASRTPLAPDYPTAAEAAGLPGYEAITWIGLLAPGATAGAIVTRINGELQRLAKQKEVRDQLASQYWDPYTQSPSAFADLIRTDIVKWGKVVRESGAKQD